MAGSIKAGEAFLELTVRDQKFRVGLSGALNSLKTAASGLVAFGGSLVAVGGAITTVFAVAAKSFASMGNELAKMSARTGIGVEALSELVYAAEQSGVDIGTLEANIRIMQRSLAGFGKQGKQARAVLAALGIDARILRGQLPSEQFKLLVTAIGSIPNPAQRAAAAMTLFGRSGTAILPLVGHLKELSDEAQHFGLTPSEESVRKAEKLESAFGLLGATFKSLKFSIGDAFGDSLTSAIRAVSEMVAATTKWVKANQQAIATVGSLGRVALGLGLGLVALGGALPIVLPAIEALSHSVNVLALPMSVARASMVALAGVVSFLLTPFGAVIAVIGAATAAFVYFSGVGAGVVKFLREKFTILFQIASQTFSAIGDALSGGDILAAANVLWAGLKLAWLKGTEDLRVAWAAFSNDAIGIFAGLAFDVESLWVQMATAFKKAFGPELVGYAESVGERIGHALSRAKTVDELDEEIVNVKEQLKFAPGGPNSVEAQQLRKRMEELRKQKRDAMRLGPEQEKLMAEQDKAHDEAMTKFGKRDFEAERKERLQEIADAQRRADEGRGDHWPADLAQIEAETAAAQKAFDEARAKAHAARGKGFGKDLAGQGAFDPGALGDVAEAAKGLTRFTFSGKLAPQVFGAAGDDVPKQQLKQAKKAADLLQDIKDKLPFNQFRIGNA